MTLFVPDKPKGTLIYRFNTDTTVPGDSSLVTLNWDSVQFDTVNGFNIANPERITAPSWASFVKVMAHVLFAPQTIVGSVDGVAHCHLFRNGLSTGDVHYHVYIYYPVGAVGGARGFNIKAVTPWIPIQSIGEYWSVPVGQNTGQDAELIQSGLESWFYCQFK